MGQTERDILAGKYPGLRIDPDSPWIDREEIDLSSPQGTAVVFHGDGGEDRDHERAKELTVGALYTVQSIHVESWSSAVELREFPGLWFNTVLFEQPRQPAPK